MPYRILVLAYEFFKYLVLNTKTIFLFYKTKLCRIYCQAKNLFIRVQLRFKYIQVDMSVCPLIILFLSSVFVMPSPGEDSQ